MRIAALRCTISALFTTSASVSPSIRRFRSTLVVSPLFFSPSRHETLITASRPRTRPFHSRLFSSSALIPPPMASSDSATVLPMGKQFDDFRTQLDESAGIRDRIKKVTTEMESALRLMNSGILLVHQSLPVPQVLERVGAQIEVLKELYKQLAEILKECPGQYYRYHGDWRSETQNAISLIAFLHWLETGTLLMHTEAEEKLGLNSSEFGLDVEDYLTGLCFMSNELPRYVVNRVTAGDYDCPRKILKFLTDLHVAFRMLNLRNDFLRKKFDSLKYDLRRVEEVYYDVKIRGLAPGDAIQDQAGQS